MGRLRAVLPEKNNVPNEMQNWTWALLRAEVQGHKKPLFLKPGIKYFFILRRATWNT